nr:tetratricopeptide repeat protein [Pseudonocardiales bacterium]
MSGWPRWQLDGEERALAHFVLPDEVAKLAQVPARSGEATTTRLGEVYRALSELGIGYVFEASSDEAGRQVIRPPDQVLWAPGHGTCLDLALVLAGGCLHAGLHPVVVILAAPGGTGALHAIVLIRLDRDLDPTAEPADPVWHTPPDRLTATVQRKLDGSRAYVAVDPVGLARSLGATATLGLDVELDEAIANGARYLLGSDDEPAWGWRLGVDIGRAWRAQDTLDPGPRPALEPLREPYRSADTAESPLRLLRAEYALVRFQARDELTVLLDWCHTITAGSATGIGVITGLGGAGKTRLALELAQRLRAQGWYAGILPKGNAGVEWLAGVLSPVLVVLDYADGRAADAVTLLQALQARQGAPAVVLLTARSGEGDWLPTIQNALIGTRHPYQQAAIALPDTHPDSGDLYRQTVRALTSEAVTPPRVPDGIRWTTLDVVLLGWIAAQGAASLPSTPGELYEAVLGHEVDYWCTVHTTPHPERRLLRKAAACVSLTAPDEERAYEVLTAVPELADDPAERRAARRTLVTCLSPAPGEGLAVRPDPVGDHLMLTELDADRALFTRTLDSADRPGKQQAVIALTRAGQNNPERATGLITTLLDTQPGEWPLVLSVAAAVGGAAADSIQHITARSDCPLPLTEISHQIPFTSTGLYAVGLQIDRRLLADARNNTVAPADLAALLERVSAREMYAGDRDGALSSITEAVQIRRRLAQANPAAYLPDLAMSLNNLCVQQSGTGDRDGALASITEAVEHYRRLAQANPAAYLPDLAMSLINLSVQQSGTGDRDGALASITEAVQIRRRLAQDNPAAYLPDLAMSLNNLSNRQSGTGDRDGALASITEAVEHYRRLAQANPAAYLPDLAMSLNNLSNLQSVTGDRDGALASITEAVEH